MVLTNNTTGPPAILPGTLFRVVFWCSLGIVEAFSLLGNTIIIYIIMTRKNLHSNTNWFLLSLAVSDICVPLFIIPSHLVCTETHVACDNRAAIVIYNFILFASVLNLCACTSERYIAILHPFRYIYIVNRRRVVAALFHVWILPLPLSILPVIFLPRSPDPALADRVYWLTQVVVFMIVPSAVMLAAFWRIHRIAMWHANQIKRLSLVPEEERVTGGRQKLFLEARSTLKVYGMVVAVFTLSWLLSAYRMIKQKFLLGYVPIELDYISRLLLVSNSALNPFIYGMQKADIKEKFLSVLKRNRFGHTGAMSSNASNAINSGGNDYLRNDTADM